MNKVNNVNMSFWTAVKVGLGFTIGVMLTAPLFAAVFGVLSLLGVAFFGRY